MSVCWFQCLGVCTCLSVYWFGFGFFLKKDYNNKVRFYSLLTLVSELRIFLPDFFACIC